MPVQLDNNTPEPTLYRSAEGFHDAYPLTTEHLDKLADMVTAQTGQTLTRPEHADAEDPDAARRVELSDTVERSERSALLDGATLLAYHREQGKYGFIFADSIGDEYGPHIPNLRWNADGLQPSWYVFMLDDQTTITALCWDVTIFRHATHNNITRLKWRFHPLSPTSFYEIPVGRVEVIMAIDLTHREIETIVDIDMTEGANTDQRLNLPHPSRIGIIPGNHRPHTTGGATLGRA